MPARGAQLGLCDRIFTRLGSADDISKGASTFMVEMAETANILNHATAKSVIVLDEVGRGTSAYNGVSLAWAISEYILGELGSRTVFATHYHELTQLAAKYTGAKNLNVAVREWQDELIFLHKIVRGRRGPQLRHPRGQARRHSRGRRAARQRNPRQARSRQPDAG